MVYIDSFLNRIYINLDSFQIKHKNMLNKLICPEYACCLCVAFVFLVAFIDPSFFVRNSVLGKLLLVTGVIAMTMCHRIAGIVALIFVIALLNRPGVDSEEGFTPMSMVRPHVRRGKKMISNSIEQFRLAANRINRTLFAN
jgi:hypothetical protein